MAFEKQQQGVRKNITWSTQIVDNWMRDHAEGSFHKENPWLDGQVGIKRAGLLFDYTSEEIEELTKSANDVIYFANHYGYCMHGTQGYKPITLRDYQEEMLRSYTDNRFTCCMSSRQVGKTVVAAIFLLHEAIFNVDRNIGIAANKLATAVEIMDKIKEIMDYLPFFMKPGIKVYNQTMIVFENGCRIIAQATTKRSFIGFTIHTLYCDEFAHVEPHILDEFYENIMPTVSSMEDSKIIITSTPNGYNKFFDIYQGGVDGTNSYHSIRVDWWQVPGRDDTWKEKTIADCGGEDEFMRQFGNSFLSTGNTLLSPDSLAKLQKGRVKYVRKELPEVEKNWEEEYKELKFHPDFDVDELRNPEKRWVLSIDLSEGGGGDNSILNLFNLRMKTKNLMKDFLKDPDREVKKSDYFQLVQVGRFKSNITTLPKLAKLTYVLVNDIIGSDNIRVVVEYNAFGGEFLRLLQTVFGDNNNFDMSCILKFNHTLDAKVKKYGLKVRPDNKPVLCITLKGMISTDNVIVTDDDTVGEFEVFSKIGSTWKASRDHDDLAMSTVDVTAIFDHPYFEVMMEEVMGLEENEEMCKILMSKMDEKYGNLYDNYQNISKTIPEEDLRYTGSDFGGYFGNKGIYN
jgi:hypothetical protein